MRILFVNPSRLDGKNGNVVKYRRAFLPPLSLALLDALTPDCHSVRIVNDIVEEVDLAERHDLVAITAMTTQIGRAYQIADSFRRRGVKVVIGGIHATVLPEEAKQHADAVVIGEADNLWAQVLDDCQNRVLKEFYQDSTRPDLQTLVLPRWDHMNMRIYPKRLGVKLPSMPLFTTRGCPFGCKFCSVTKFFGKSYRMRPVSHLLRDIDATGTTDYFFVDDNIACNPDYSRELFRALASRRIRWFGQISTTVLWTPDLIDLAAKGGCSYLFIGVESLNSASLATVNKRFNRVEHYEELVARMRRAGIIPYLSFVFGFDSDTPEQWAVTLEFLRRNRVGSVVFWILTPLPGTDLFAEMQVEGRIDTNDWSRYDLTHVVFQPRNVTKEQLVDKFWETSRRAYSIPNILRSIFWNVRCSRRPISQLLGDLFYSAYYRRKVYSRDHPWSGGIGLVKPRN